MDASAIADRRRLRRKLAFWRIGAALLLVAAGLLLYRLLAPEAALDRSVPHIARVEITGLIQDDKELLDRLKSIAEADRVKALVVSISSPGGTTYGGERIFKAIRAVAEKKPVVSDVRTLAASAGYMIASAGDTIIAGETSITGSIGVIFQYPQAKDLLDKIGVSLEEIKSAPLKAEPSPFHPASEEAKAMIRAMVMDSYDWFVDIVAERRNLDRPKALQLADGRVFSGHQALEAGLIDEIGGEETAIAWLTTKKGVDARLRVVDWEPESSSSPFSFSSAAFVWLARQAGFSPDLLYASGVAGLLPSRLQLDGLLSVWHAPSGLNDAEGAPR